MWKRMHLGVSNINVSGVQRSCPSLGDLDRSSLSLDVPTLTSFPIHVGVLWECPQNLEPDANLPSGVQLKEKEKIYVKHR